MKYTPTSLVPVKLRAVGLHNYLKACKEARRVFYQSIETELKELEAMDAEIESIEAALGETSKMEITPVGTVVARQLFGETKGKAPAWNKLTLLTLKEAGKPITAGEIANRVAKRTNSDRRIAMNRISGYLSARNKAGKLVKIMGTDDQTDENLWGLKEWKNEAMTA